MMNDGGRGSNSGGVGAGQTFAAHGYISLYMRAIFSEKTFPSTSTESLQTHEEAHRSVFFKSW